MSEFNETNRGVWSADEIDGGLAAILDAAIDQAVMMRVLGHSTGQRVAGQADELGADGPLIAELARLGELDWPPEEVGERIALAVVAAKHSPGRSARQRAVLHGRSRWITLAAAAAAAALVAGAFQLAGHHHSGTHNRHFHGGSPGSKVVSHRSHARITPGATLAAMVIVSRPGEMHRVGAFATGNGFLTCVSRSVCYVDGVPSTGNGVDIARTTDGGVTWKAGAALPPPNAEWNVGPSCPQPMTCYVPFGADLVATNDGFAHVRVIPVSVPSGSIQQVSLASCPTSLRCVVAVNQQAIAYTEDGGATWAMASVPGFAAGQFIAQLRCDRLGTCVAAVSGGDANNGTVAGLSSTDGGRSWSMSHIRSLGPGQQWLVSCADGRDCVYGQNSGALAWLHVAAHGTITISVRSVPANWGMVLALSCPRSQICFAERNDDTIEVTHDAGVTWTSLGKPVPDLTISALSCPVVAGCVGIAGQPSSTVQIWVVLSNLRPHRHP